MFSALGLNFEYYQNDNVDEEEMYIHSIHETIMLPPMY